MARVEEFELGLDARLPDTLRDRLRVRGTLMSAPLPKLSVPMSRLQISGLSDTMWRTRSCGVRRFEPGAAVLASVSLGTNRAPGPVVRLTMTGLPLSRMRSTTSRYRSNAMLALPVLGSRTWMCAMAAPAVQASIAARAISSGVTGTFENLPAVSSPPVTAQVMMMGRLMGSGRGWRGRRRGRPRA